jgi:hypothetical protein
LHTVIMSTRKKNRSRLIDCIIHILFKSSFSLHDPWLALLDYLWWCRNVRPKMTFKIFLKIMGLALFEYVVQIS